MNCLQFLFLAMAFKYAKMARVNQGVIVIIVVLAIVFNSISFYFAFGEKPSLIKFVGMFFCICTSVLLALNGMQTD